MAGRGDQVHRVLLPPPLGGSKDNRREKSERPGNPYGSLLTESARRLYTKSLAAGSETSSRGAGARDWKPRGEQN